MTPSADFNWGCGVTDLKGSSILAIRRRQKQIGLFAAQTKETEAAQRQQQAGWPVSK